MKSYKRLLILYTFLFISILYTYSYPQSQKYIKWKHISSEKLLDKSTRLSKSRETADSSFIYATVVCNRYEENISKEEKIICAKSYLNLWYLCFTYYNDYSKAYSYIIKADEIRNELKIDLPYLDLYLGCFYHFLADQNNNKSLIKEALLYYKRVLKKSIETQDTFILNETFYNVITLLFHNIEEIPDIYNLYKQATFAENNTDYIYNKIFYNTLLLVYEGKYDEAFKLTEQLVIPKKDKNYEEKRKWMLELLKSYIFYAKKDYKSSINYIKNAEDIAVRNDIYEMKLSAYKKLAENYRLLNNKYEYLEYKNKYLTLKDSIFGYGQISSLSNIKFIGKIDKMNVEITAMKQKEAIQNILLTVVCIILIIIAVCATILYNKNKQISKKNDTLFHNYRDLCLIEEQLRNKIKENNPNISKEDKQKYTTSSLQNEEKDCLLDKIITVMENTEEICSPNFSTDRLAELVGANYKYISQVINEKYGYSFSHLLNKYRVKEICRRFADTEKYGNYTTEAIAEGVGFKNRTTFINAFKKETGMTPYQYLKFIQKDRMEQNI